ncbi:MAG: molybdopterin converting factor subunit 1 [Hyphomicrobiaceae bacterium]|nr:molybdopterin converting factor subunit 1 [Hyphomicrobiaceae bacterium]
MGRVVSVRYFAWVRERIGKAEETVEVPDEVTTARDLVFWLKGRGEEYDYALEKPEVIRVAFDQMHVEPEAGLEGVREIALFPPMTGG